MRPGDAGRETRPLRPVRRLLALPGLQLHPQERSAAARASCRSRSRAPSAGRGTSSRGERGGRAASSGAARAIRSAISRRRASRSERCMTPTTALWHETASRATGICLKCGAPVELPDPVVVGQKLPGGEPNPEALAAPRRRGGGGRRTARLDGRRKPDAALRFLIDERSTPRSSGCVTGAQALDAFLGRLAARDSSEHTRRAYQTAITQYLDWLDEPPRRLALAAARPGPRLHGHAGRARPRQAIRSAAGSRRCAPSIATRAASSSSKATHGRPP